MQSAVQGTPLASVRVMSLTVFESLKQYVGFNEASSAALRELHPAARPRTEVAQLVEAATQSAALPPTITVDVAPDVSRLTIDVDPDQLQQVLINLLTNAAQAMAGGGRLFIEGELSPNGDTRLRVQPAAPRPLSA